MALVKSLMASFNSGGMSIAYDDIGPREGRPVEVQNPAERRPQVVAERLYRAARRSASMWVEH